MRQIEITKPDSQSISSTVVASITSITFGICLPMPFRILDDCLLTDSELEEFRQSALSGEP